MKRILPYLLSFLFLASSIVYVAGADKADPPKPAAPAEQAAEKAPEQPAAIKPTEEVRGVWLTYLSLDVEDEADKEAAFRQRIDSVIEDMTNANLNTLIVQVRPFCDALYPSRYFPWSHILTGTQGEDPGYDPLEYIVSAAHAHEIKVHAWLNPYRISTEDTPSQLSGDNPYVKTPELGVEVNGSLYLNPASQAAVDLIVSGVQEIVSGYEIDAIQFDDYFYPPDCGDFDAQDYEAYCAENDAPLSLADYRRENVNRMVKAVFQGIRQLKSDVMFGISPQGNLSNNEALYADVKAWCAEPGYIDYICPQLYFSLDNPALTFEDALQEWLDLEQHDGLSLYVGLPAYKAGTDADSGTWLDNDDILKTELQIAREHGADGFMLYSWDSFHNEDSAEEVQNVIRYLTTSPTQ